mgnify:FL=1
MERETVDFFLTPYFLVKADKKIAEEISEEVKDILEKKKTKKFDDLINYRNYSGNKIRQDLKKDQKRVASLCSLGFDTYTSVGGFLDNGGGNIELKDLPNKIQNHISENIDEIPMSLNYRDMWINITSNHDYNRCHNHKVEADLVFVLYLTKGTLWLRNPHHRPKLDRVYNHVGSSLSIEFNTGDMIIFPSDIDHWVEPHKENYDRISIAGNLSIN